MEIVVISKEDLRNLILECLDLSPHRESLSVEDGNIKAQASNDVEKILLKIKATPKTKMREFLQTKIADLDLLVRSYNVLKELGIGTVEGILAVDKNTFLKTRGCGPKVYRDILVSIARAFVNQGPNSLD